MSTAQGHLKQARTPSGARETRAATSVGVLS